MFVFIEGLPPAVLAMEARGEVTHEDYRDTLIPNAEAMMARGRSRCSMSSGRIFTAFELRRCRRPLCSGSSIGMILLHIRRVTDHDGVKTPCQ